MAQVKAASPAQNGAEGSIVLRAVGKHFGKTRVLEHIDLEILPGELCVFVGPSGCGKSTLLRIISGLEHVSTGELWIGGRKMNDVDPSERGIAMVFQSYALYPHMTVRQNLEFGLKADKAEAERRIEKAAKMLQIDQLLARKPNELSGGQRQRVAIGRAITRQPKIFLFDEPLSNLDAALRVSMRSELARLHKQLGTTMVYVTHDQVEAMTMADRIVVLNGGHIEHAGPPLEVYQHPRTLFAAGFLGSPRMNFVKGKLVGGGAEGAVVELPGGASVRARVKAEGGSASAKAGDEVTLGVRPEHLVVTKAEGEGAAGGGALTGRVALVEELGDHTIVHVETEGSGRLLARVPQAPGGEGTAVRLGLPPEECHVFDAKGMALPRL